MNLQVHDAYTKNGSRYYLVDWPFHSETSPGSPPLHCLLARVPAVITDIDRSPPVGLHRALLSPGRKTSIAVGVLTHFDECWPASHLADASRFALVTKLGGREIAHRLVDYFDRASPSIDRILSAPYLHHRLPELADRVLNLAFDGPLKFNPIVEGARKILEDDCHGHWQTAVAARAYVHSYEVELNRVGRTLPSEHWLRCSVFALILANTFEMLFEQDKTAALAVGWMCGYLSGAFPSWSPLP